MKLGPGTPAYTLLQDSTIIQYNTEYRETKSNITIIQYKAEPTNLNICLYLLLKQSP